MEDRYDISVDIGEGKDWWYVHGRTTHDKVYELNRQMCDIDIPLRNPIKPLSEETAQELIGKWEKIGKEWASKKKEIVESIFGNITNEKSNIMEEKKTKKMTKAEAFEWLSNKKIDASINEREVQLKLFSLGVVWCTLDSKPTLGVGYLFLDKECHMTHGGSNWDYYKHHCYEEISADDILSIEIVDENKSEEEKALDKISYLGAQIVDILLHMKGHHHVTITETDVILYNEGMSLFHSDPF